MYGNRYFEKTYMKQKKQTQSPIHILLVSHATSKKEQDIHSKVVRILEYLIHKKGNIFVTVITNFKPEQKNARITIKVIPPSFFSYVSTLIESALKKHYDYLFVSSCSKLSFLWIYAKLFGMHSVCIKHMKRRQTWHQKQYEVIFPLMKKSTPEYVYKQLYQASLLAKI